MQQNTVAARSGGRKVPFRLSYILLITIVILSLILSGCTKTQGTAAVPAGKKTVATVSLAGEVQLPAGVSAGGGKVVNGLGSASLDNRSQFKLKAVAGSRQFTVVMSPSGSPMLMGWPSAQNPKINARSTAEVLVYMATGLFTVPGASQRAALEMLDQSNDLDDLEKAISESLAADADALSKSNPRIISALGEAVARISQPRQYVGWPTKGVSFGLAATAPMTRSGLTLNTDQGINSLYFSNAYRRPAYAFIDRLSVYDKDGAEQNSPQKLSEFAINAATGMSGVASTLVDIVQGNFAYTAQATDPVALPIPEGFNKARYRVAVVGPTVKTGSTVDPDWSALKDNERVKHDEVAAKFLIQDYFLRYFMALLLPGDMLNDFFKFFAAGSLFQDLYGYITSTFPTGIELAKKGRIKDAFYTLVKDFVASNAFKDVLFKSLEEGLKKAYGLEAVAEFGDFSKKCTQVLFLADAIVLTFDQAVMTVNLATSHDADIWEIVVTQPKVALNPGSADLFYEDEVVFTATVPEQSGSGANLTYSWSSSATSGELKDGLPDHKDTFDSSRNKVTYRATSTETSGADTITVEVYALAGGGQGERQYLGKASAEVKTRWAPGTINLTVGNIPYLSEYTYAISANLLEKNASIYSTTRWARDPGGYPLIGSVLISNFGETVFPPGEYKIVVFAYNKDGVPFQRSALSFRVKGGVNDVRIPFPYIEYYTKQPWTYSVASENWPKGVSLESTWPPAAGFGVGVVGKPRGLVVWYGGGVTEDPKPALPGDTVQTELGWYNVGEDAVVPDKEKLILGQVWLYSWLDGEKYCLTYGGDFSRYFPVGETVVERTSFVIPPLKPLPPAPVPPTKPKPPTPTPSGTTSATATFATPTGSSTPKPSSSPSVTPAPSGSSPAASSSATPSPTPSSPSPTPSATEPSKTPSGIMDIWATRVNDSAATRMQNIPAGTVDRLYFWAKGPVNLESDFSLVITSQGGNQTKIDRHASNGGVVSCGSMSGDYLKTPGTVNLQAISASGVLGNATLTITAPPAMLPIETVVTNLAKNSGTRPPGATENNDWWYWDLTLKNPNTVGVTLTGGQKHIATPYEEGTSPLTTSMADAFGTNYLAGGGELTWHNAYMYFSKRPAPFQATRTVTIFGKDDLGRDVSIEYTLTVTVGQ